MFVQLFEKFFLSPGSREDSKKRKHKKTVWLISFTDVMSLMMAFFVLLFSMKTPDDEKWSNISSIMQGEYGTHYTGPQFSGIVGDEPLGQNSRARYFTLNYLEALIKNYLKQDEIFRNASYSRDKRQLVLKLPLSELKKGEYEQSFAVLASSLSPVRNSVEFFVTLAPGSSINEAFSTSQDLANLLKESGYEQDIIFSGYQFSDKIEPVEQNLPVSFGFNTVHLIVYDDLAAN